MSYRHWTWAVLALAACASPDSPSFSGPDPDSPPVDPNQAVTPIPPGSGSLERDRHDRLARRFAIAMSNPGFRAAVHRELSGSQVPEGKVHLQGYLNRNGASERHRLAQLVGESESAVATDLDQGAPIEIYLPVPAHRLLWRGDENLLVATAERDTDSPVAYDLAGRRFNLSPSRPPATPVLMVSRAEATFGPRPQGLICVVNCGGGGGGGGAPGAGPGLYLTQTKFTGTFEGWFKGSPEFEVHILGPVTPGSPTMTTYQCAGAEAGAPYSFDQNSDAWAGSVLLFSQSQLDQYKAQNPGQGLRVVVIEDDDTACQIKVDSTRVVKMLDAIKIVYGDLTGAKDTTSSTGTKILTKAPVYYRILKAIASFFLTNDDPVGNAVEDPPVASTYFSGANWVVKGENTTTNGALRLEMK